MSSTSVIIVGAGQAGGRTAQALRRLGHRGSITVLGDEPVLPYERPPLSKDVLLGRADPASLSLLPEAGWRDLDVTMHCSARVVAIDRTARRVRLADGTSMAFDHLVLATGARPRAFPGCIEAGAELFYLRTVADALRLRPRLAPGQRIGIIGAGFIGLELAATARTLGAAVTLIEAAARPLARLLPQAFALAQLARHRAHGVDILLGESVKRLSSRQIHLASERLVEVDTVVIGIGARANDELAQAAGLDVRDGIVVDAAGRTRDPAIYAIGDVARTVEEAAGRDDRLESWRHAENSAQAVAAAILQLPAPPAATPWFWTDQYGRNIQIAGRPSDSHHCVVKGGDDDGPQLIYYLDSAQRVRGAIGIDCARELRGAIKQIEAGAPVNADELPAPRIKKPLKVEVTSS